VSASADFSNWYIIVVSIVLIVLYVWLWFFDQEDDS
jgi:hypothetical protein